jgi:inosine-uridine nucleoside N-ribohydrolase
MKRILWSACFLALLLAVSSCGPGPQSTTAPTLIPADVPTVAANPPAASPTETPAPVPTRPAQRMPVIYDDDGSPDGTAALFYLLSDPEVSVEGISISFGEAHPEAYIQHIARELDYLGMPDIPLGAGQDAPLAGSNEFPGWLREVSDEFWGLPVPNLQKTFPAQDAAELMVSLLSQAPEPVTVFVSGPCTNLAQALRLDPAIKEHIAAVYIMGGAVHVPGNIDDLVENSGNTVAEWNIYADPQAAAEVLESGLDIYLVPLDATNEITVGRQDAEQWRQGGGTAGFAADVYDMLFEAWGTEAAAAWDLVTAAIMVRPDLCAFQPLYLEVIAGDGNTSGQTVVVPDVEPNVQACLEPDGDQIKQMLNEVFARSQ